jgi:hypothetical protein
VEEGEPVVVEPVAKGGDSVALVGDDVVHAYTTVGNGTFALSVTRDVQALVVAGGASGTRGWCSRFWGHGGGGGGVSGGVLPLAPGSYQTTVGAGGSGSTGQDCSVDHTGRAGATSSLTSSQATLLSATGGAGAGSQQARGGASGAGTIDGQARTANLGGIGTGGAVNCTPGDCGAGGGGGAGGAGDVHDGGAGIQSSITGATVTYGQGGAGRSTGLFGSPGEGAKGPGGGGSDGTGGGFTAGNAGTVILRYTLTTVLTP